MPAIEDNATAVLVIAELNDAGFQVPTDAEFNAFLSSGAIGTTVQGFSTVLANTTASFTTADETKLDGLDAANFATAAQGVTADSAIQGVAGSDGEAAIWNATGDLISEPVITLTFSGDTNLSASVGAGGVVGPLLGSDGAGNVVQATASTARTFLNVEDGSQANTIGSVPAASGADQIINMESLTQAEYDAAVKIATTLYVITDAT